MKIVIFILVLALGGCTSLERSIVRGKVKSAFEATAMPGSSTDDLGAGLHSYRWLTYRTLWLETSEGVAVFDPLNRSASLAIRRAVARSPKPTIRYVIYSHSHRDHASGADALGGKPAILAHRETASELRLHGFRDVVRPTEEFDGDEHTLVVGGEEIRLVVVHGAHTGALTAAYFPARRLLYAVDLVWPHELPPPAAPMSFSGVERALDRLLELDFDRFVAGHGAIGTRHDVERYRAFLRELRQEFAAALERRGLRDLHDPQTFIQAPDQLGAIFYEVIDALEPRYGDWTNYDEAILATVQWGFWSVLTGD